MARAICFLFAGLLAASLAASGESRLQVRSIVRADARTGRLVRTATVKRQPAAPALAPLPGPPAGPDAAAPAPPAAPVTDLTAIVRQASETHGVDPALVDSVVAVESGFNPLAVSPKGAQGLMQLMPGTARRFGVTDSFDVRQNIEAGVKYLRLLQDKFKDDRLALAAYNAGEGAVMRHGGIPPYRETEKYVEKVGRRLNSARRTLPAAKPAGISSESVETAKTPSIPEPPPFRALEWFTDDSGRIHLVTKDLAARPSASSQ